MSLLSNTRAPELPAFTAVVGRLIVAEQDCGWTAACADADCYLALCHELVEALARQLDSAAPCLEICSGSGALARALQQHGVRVSPSDPYPADPDLVEALSATEALRKFQPATVVACFPPLDAQIHAAVIACPSVCDFVLLQSRQSGIEPDELAQRGWLVEPLATVARWMITRHDVWLPAPFPRLLQHGQAWRFRRRFPEAALSRNPFPR